MITGPGDEKAAGASGRGHLRASHADREQVIAALQTAFIQGRLTKDELDLRVGLTLGSRTYTDLAALTADLPAGLPAAQPPGLAVPARAQPPTNKALLWGSWAIVLLTVGFMLGTFPADYRVALLGVLPLLITVPIAGTLTIDSWREKRSRGQLPQGPAPGAAGRASPRTDLQAGTGPPPRNDRLHRIRPRLHRAAFPALRLPQPDRVAVHAIKTGRGPSSPHPRSAGQRPRPA